MEIRGKKICGLNTLQVRDALRAFLAEETPMPEKKRCGHD
jgi:hypothetical protein